MYDDLNMRLERARRLLSSRRQDHVLRWWPELDDRQRDGLLGDIESVPWELMDDLLGRHLRPAEDRHGLGSLDPATVHPLLASGSIVAAYAAAREQGAKKLAAGKVAALTVAGGQGTRLGVSGPKGLVAVTPVTGRSLFQLFAETVLAAGRKYGVAIPWYIMTSPVNHAETVAFFEARQFFGLRSEDVRFFTQGVLPAFDLSGNLLLDQKDRLALAPDGHGGTLKALAGSGALDDLVARQVEIVSYFQVDNPLVKPFDPLFIGLHTRAGSEMSTKVTRKADDLERVGNICLRDRRLTVIEYIDFPQECATARNPDGSRRFDAGNLAIHLFDTAFLRRVTSHPLLMPYRRAEKVVAFIDDAGQRVTPKSPNAVKLETFIFDVLPMARNPMVLEVDRAEEFSPVKNPTGVDSLETSKRDQVRRAARWLEAAGVAVPRTAGGEPDATIEIGPLFALDSPDLTSAGGALPLVQRGGVFSLV